MSVPGTRPNAEQTSVSVVRGLLERNLLDRAVAIAETRWPGSGPLVRLAHEWSGLSAADRRQRLAAIGPEDLARLRTLAAIQPDLARVLDDLESRGILPPVADMGQQVDVTSRPEAASPSFARTLQAATDEGALADNLVAPPTRPTPPPVATHEPAPERPPRNHQVMTPLPQSSRPTLDLGLPSTSEFMEMEVERRARVVEQTESILDRVRARLDETADRLVEQRPQRTPPERSAPLDSVSVEPAPVTQLSAAFERDSARDTYTIVETDERTAAPHQAQVATQLAMEFRSSVVVEIERYEPIPTPDDISATARELNLDVVYLAPNDMGTREFWGGLERAGKNVTARAGQFPRALSGHNLVVVQGRLTTRAIDRINAGYCDIPGTRATVRVADRARVLVLPA